MKVHIVPVTRCSVAYWNVGGEGPNGWLDTGIVTDSKHGDRFRNVSLDGITVEHLCAYLEVRYAYRFTAVERRAICRVAFREVSRMRGRWWTIQKPTAQALLAAAAQEAERRLVYIARNKIPTQSDRRSRNYGRARDWEIVADVFGCYDPALVKRVLRQLAFKHNKTPNDRLEYQVVTLYMALAEQLQTGVMDAVVTELASEGQRLQLGVDITQALICDILDEFRERLQEAALP